MDKMELLNMVVEMEKLIEKQNPVFLNTDRCHRWWEEHNKNCQGCPSELGCLKMNMLLQLETARKSGMMPAETYRFIRNRVLGATKEEIEVVGGHILIIKRPPGRLRTLWEFLQNRFGPKTIKKPKER